MGSSDVDVPTVERPLLHKVMRLMVAVKETAVAQVAMEKVMIVIFVIMMIHMIAAMMTTLMR